MEIDLKGWLPRKAVDMAADDVPTMLALFRDYVESSE